MTALGKVLTDGAARLSAVGIDSARLDARVLLACVLKQQPGELIGRGDISAEDAARFEVLIERRVAREPVAYITGRKEFWSLDFEVGPGVLVPRPETETLIEQALLEFSDRGARLDAIDFGTGSGCILLAFLSESPNARGIGIERSAEAMAYAQRNKANLSAGTRCTLATGDWSLAPAELFDAVFSNPPYLTQKELSNASPELKTEPPAALVGGDDGLETYRVLAPLISARLKPNGRAFLEIGAEQAAAVTGILTSAGLEILRVAPDVSGTPRCIVARPQKTVGMTGPSL
jgi:release factor glutamine methyltransferase